jgi:hypothetical protein
MKEICLYSNVWDYLTHNDREKKAMIEKKLRGDEKK